MLITVEDRDDFYPAKATVRACHSTVFINARCLTDSGDNGVVLTYSPGRAIYLAVVIVCAAVAAKVKSFRRFT